MSSSDKYLDHMLEKALEYQQHFYKLLPDWTVYKTVGIKYLKQNIGYAIFGPPLVEKKSNSNDILNFRTNFITDDTEVGDLVVYGSEATKVITLIADQICKHGKIPGTDTIKCGICYLIIIDNYSSAQSDRNRVGNHIALPLFKILKYNDISNVSTKKSTNIKDTYTTWYIDIKGRVYKGWEDFITANDLPKCIIVYPKDGYYQPNPEYSITPESSIVWVITQDSKACSQRAEVVSTINRVVNTVGAGATIGLGVASLVTPVGPAIATAGLVTTSVSGLWTIGKCSTELYDRKVHEESISPLNKSALSSWLGIAGCTVGVAANGGSILLKKAAKSGIKVGTIAKTAYNAALIGSVSINLMGLGYQGVNIYEKYKEKGTIDMQDLVYFGTHLLFFTSNIVNIKFANSIIEATQGDVLKEFEANLHNDNLRKRYNIMKNKAEANYRMDQIEKNNYIIRYINKCDTSHVSEVPPISNSLQSSSSMLVVQSYKLKINGITLIDPMLFVVDFAKSYLGQTTKKYGDQSNSYSDIQSRMLMKIMERLLGDLYTSKDCPPNEQFLATTDFKTVINDIRKIKGSEDILPSIFNIALVLAKAWNNYAYLVEGCRFVWNYVKKNMHEAGLNIISEFDCVDDNWYNSTVQHMWAIFGAFYNALDLTINRFLNALQQYIDFQKTANMSYLKA